MSDPVTPSSGAVSIKYTEIENKRQEKERSESLRQDFADKMRKRKLPNVGKLLKIAEQKKAIMNKKRPPFSKDSFESEEKNN